MSRRGLEQPELDTTPEKDHIWAAAEVHAENLDIPDHRPPHPERELWYVPTLTIWDAHRAEELFSEYGIERVYDLGAGDCRFSLWLSRRGYDVVAYELNHDLAESVRERFWLKNMELRQRDYYEDYDDLVDAGTAVVAFGGTNELPSVPDEGIGIQGYGETGITAWYEGRRIAAW